MKVYFAILIKSQQKSRLGMKNISKLQEDAQLLFKQGKEKKYVNNVLLVPFINQILLNIGQMIEREYSIHFK